MSEEIRILKQAQTENLSGRGILNYEIGSKGDSLYIRLSGNSEKGLFCKNWVPMEAIHQLLTANETITSKVLQTLYDGRSVNSPGFMMAVLKHLGLILNTDEKSRTHRRADPTAFNNAMKELIANETLSSKAENTAKVKKSKTNGRG